MAPLLTLDDARSRDPRVVGAKAAGLARARAAGLPVLPGWVVPAELSAAALRLGGDAFARSGHAAAVLATTTAPLGDRVGRALGAVAGALGGSAIVRSSTGSDADPRWAGAFATYTDVVPGDLATAVRGCWGSMFSRDVLGRCEAMGVEPGAIGMAVLIQPWVAFDTGGTADVLGDGRVRVTAGPGAPADLVAGRSWATAIDVGLEQRSGSPDGDVGLKQRSGTPNGDVGISRDVTELALSAQRETGATAIEWGRSAGRLVLLQVRTSPVVSSAAADGNAHRPERSFPPVAERLAALAIAFPGPLGDRWVLPWAATAEELPVVAPIRVADLVAAVASARALASALTARAWGSAPADAAREAAAAIRSVLGPDPEPGLERFDRLRPVDPARAARLLGLVAGIGRALAARGRPAGAELVWRLPPEELDRAAGSGELGPERRGPDRWEPFVAAVVAANGAMHGGAPASPGIGAGRVRILRGPDPGWRPGPREVLALTEAAPQAAPYLWNAAGLVTARGSAGAHLFEVARSLGVPAVVGADVPAEADGALAAVDGDAATVSVLAPWTSSMRRMEA